MTRDSRERKTVELSHENILWFNSTYPRSNFSWVLDMLLTEFRRAHKETPRDYAALGAAELKRLVDGEVKEIGGGQ